MGLRFSIVSLNWNGRRILGQLLDKHVSSLLGTEYDEFEVIFVDNGSDDDSVDYINSHYNDPRLKILRLQKNYGFAKGNNLALKVISKDADVVVFINNDTVVKSDWLKELARVFIDPKVGVAQPLILDLDTHAIQFMGGYADQFGRSMTIGYSDEIMNRLLLKIIKISGFSPLQILWAYGACIAVRRDILSKTGGFNELFLFSLEEQTICIPANALGYKVVLVPKSIVYHKGSATVKRLHLVKEYMRNTYLLLLIYYPFHMLLRGLLGRSLLEFFLSLRMRSGRRLMVFFQVLVELFVNLRSIISHRRRSYKLSNNSLIIRTPILLTKQQHVSLTLTKLLEINLTRKRNKRNSGDEARYVKAY